MEPFTCLVLGGALMVALMYLPFMDDQREL